MGANIRYIRYIDILINDQEMIDEFGGFDHVRVYRLNLMCLKEGRIHSKTVSLRMQMVSLHALRSMRRDCM